MLHIQGKIRDSTQYFGRYEAGPGQDHDRRPAGLWEDVATAVISEATLVEQPRGKELEYRIVAVNKSGDGSPSNTVMAAL